MNNSKDYVDRVIEKWYKKLGFAPQYDEEFYKLLETHTISQDTEISTYDNENHDPKTNFLAALYMCEAMEQKAISKGLSEEHISALKNGFFGWVNGCCKRKGEIWMELFGWARHFLKCAIFRVGRLQYAMSKSPRDIPEFNIKKGDNVVGIHIPGGSKLDIEECKSSLEAVKAFIAEKFPEFEYDHFTCCTWLLNRELSKYLPENSNILKFASLFTIVKQYESYGLLSFVFDRTVTLENLKDAVPKNDFAATIKEAILNGEKFYDGIGVIAK